jgi:hypothetical protein
VSAPVVVTLVLVLAAIALIVQHVRLKRDNLAFTVFLAIVLAALIWIPQVLRDVVLALIVVGFAIAISDATMGKVVSTVVAGAIAGLIAWQLPGGITPVVLGIWSLWALSESRDAVGHLQRLGRASRLAPHARPDGEVEVGGKLSPEVTAAPAGTDVEASMGAWQLTDLRRGIRGARPRVLTLHAREGTVHVDLERVTLRCDDAREKLLLGEPAANALAALGIHEEVTTREVDGTEIREPMLWLRWLSPEHEVYVVGTPVWESGGGAAYRDAPVVPLFGDDDGAYVVDRSELEERRRAQWTLSQWSLWGVACVSIAVAQLFA